MEQKILLIEDDIEIHEYIREIFSGEFSLMSAYSLSEADECIPYIMEYSAILIDGCISGNTLNTIPLIHLIVKKGFGNPFVAISSYDEYSNKMIEAGCTHKSTKADVGYLVKKLLKDIYT